MKKKISLLLCTLTVVFALAGCSGKDSGVEYDQATIEEATEFLISYCSTADDTTIEQWNSLSDEQLDIQMAQSGYPFTGDSFLSSMDAWQAGVDECGAYDGHGDFTYDASQTQLSVTTTAQFADREANLELIYKADVRGNLHLDSLTVSGIYSMGEILSKAGLNTLLGMGTVFCVLIIICVIISLLKYIPKLQEAFSRKNTAAPAPEISTAQASEAPAQSAPAQPAQETQAEAEDVTDDSELVAVIAAAIAASEEVPADGFIVRSIRRRKSNKWI